MSRRQTTAGSPARAEARAAGQPVPQPITGHRLFPALVALWFAALLGLGSFVVPASLIERASSAAGLAALVPAAAPPLGLTARLLIAAVMTIVGVVAGLVLALRLRPRPVEVVRRRGAVARTYDADEVEEAEPVQEEAPVLAKQEDDAPQVRAFDAHPDAPPRRPFVLSDDLVLADEPASTDHDMPRVAEPTIARDAFEEAEWTEAEGEEQVFCVSEAVATAAPDVAVESAAASPVASVIARRGAAIADAPLDTLGLVQLVERLALAIDARRAFVGGDGQPAAAPAHVPFVQPESEPVVAQSAESIEFAESIEATEPEIPRQVFVMPDPADAPAEVAIEADVELETEVAEQADIVAPDVVAPLPLARPSTPLPRLFGAGEARAQPPRILAASWDASDDDDAHDEDIVVPRFLGRAPAATATPDDGNAEPTPVSRFGAPRATPRQEFIRDHADDADASEPVVVFPGHGARAPVDDGQSRATQVEPRIDPQGAEDTERALRAALATLQRMTARG